MADDDGVNLWEKIVELSSGYGILEFLVRGAGKFSNSRQSDFSSKVLQVYCLHRTVDSWSLIHKYII